jgi:hypothetical protein
MILNKSAFFLQLFFYLINANESEISETTLTQLKNELTKIRKENEGIVK